jgi:structural maintenance of chromosome 1
MLLIALNKQKDSLHAQLRELGQSKPRGKVDEGLAADINRIESQLQLAKDDQVSYALFKHGLC